MGLEKYRIIFILILFILFSGCIKTETDIQQNIQQDIKIIPTPAETTISKYTEVSIPEKTQTPEELKKEYIDRIIVTGSNQSDLNIVKNILNDTNYKTLKYIKEIHVLDVENLDCESSNIYCYAKYIEGNYESSIILEEQSSIIYTPASNMWSLFKSTTTVEESTYGTMKLTTELCSSFEYSLVEKIGIIDAERHGLKYEDRIVDKSDFPPDYTSNFYSESIYVDYYASFHTKNKVMCG